MLIQDGWDAVIHELFNQSIKEIVVSSQLPKTYQQQLRKRLHVTLSYEDEVNFKGEYRKISEDLKDERMVEEFSLLLNYIKRTKKRSLDHLQKAEIVQLDQFMSLDMYSKKNLELTQTILKKDTYGSLLWVLDRTMTAMGAR